MNNYIFKLKFKTAVHFGSGRLSSSENFIFADTLFSAMYKEAIKIYGEKGAVNLKDMVLNSSLLLSDLFPYCGDILFIPKPFVIIESDKKGDSALKKKFKKLKFLPIEDFDKYLNGNYLPEHTLKMLDEIGEYSVRSTVKINQNKDNQPYNMGIFSFKDYKKNGLYFIAQCNEDSEDILFNIMASLSYTGLGGKISSGLGKFDYEYKMAPDSFNSRLNNSSDRYMSLSICLPQDSELDNALVNASYELVKRSGFVSSDSYSDKPLRKNDLYCFKSGSIFKNTFSGNIYDVSYKGNHAVYRYAKPMWFGID